jgi:hypothetical protein
MQNQGYSNMSMANTFAGIPSQLSPAIQSTLNTAYDPQQALYKQEYQQTMDRTNAQMAQAGLSFTPWASGVASNASEGFDTNWLATQLGRQTQGAQTIASLVGTGANAANTASSLGSTGATDIAQGAAMPYNAQTSANAQLAAMLPYLTANQQQMAQDYTNYYNASTGNTNAAISAGNANNNYMGQIGLGAGLLANSALGSSLGGMGVSAVTGLGSALGNILLPAML